MKFSLSDTSESNSIQSYDATGILVSRAQSQSPPDPIPPEHFSRSVFVCATHVLPEFPISKIGDLSVSYCQPLFDLNKTINLDVLLIGCNTKATVLLPELYHAFIEHGIGVECMSIGAACRTYNMLLNESRSVGILFLM